MGATVTGQQYCGASKARLAGAYNRRFQFNKRRQLFIRVLDETLSVAAMHFYLLTSIGGGVDAGEALAQGLVTA